MTLCLTRGGSILIGCEVFKSEQSVHRSFLVCRPLMDLKLCLDMKINYFFKVCLLVWISKRITLESLCMALKRNSAVMTGHKQNSAIMTGHENEWNSPVMIEHENNLCFTCYDWTWNGNMFCCYDWTWTTTFYFYDWKWTTTFCFTTGHVTGCVMLLWLDVKTN